MSTISFSDALSKFALPTTIAVTTALVATTFVYMQAVRDQEVAAAQLAKQLSSENLALRTDLRELQLRLSDVEKTSQVNAARISSIELNLNNQLQLLNRALQSEPKR